MPEKSDKEVLTEQTEDQIIEIDENGVVHASGKTAKHLKKTALRDPEGEYSGRN